MKNQKIGNLRALAITIVVLGHSIILYNPAWTLYESDRTCYPLVILKGIIDIIQMPLYFSISGFLFYYAQNKIKKFSQFLKDKIKRLLVPFLFFGLFWMVPIKWLVSYSGYENQSILSIVILKTLWGSDNGHLWFLEALFLVFAVMYFVCAYVYKRKSNLLNIIVFGCTLLLSFFSDKFHMAPALKNMVLYIFWFYIGFLLNYYNAFVTKGHKLISVIGTLGGIVGILVYFTVPERIIQYIVSFVWVVTLYAIVPVKTNRLTRVIEENSYGIYLFHSPLIYVTCTFFLNSNPVFVVFLNFIVFGGLSLLLTGVVKKTKLRFILGE